MKNIKLIIVEDDDAIRKMLKIYAKFYLNREAKTFETADKGLAYLEKNKVDILITDVDMPLSKIDGVELAREAKKIFPDIIIVIMSGRADIAEEAKKYGDFMLKPFALKVLTDILDKRIKERA